MCWNVCFTLTFICVQEFLWPFLLNLSFRPYQFEMIAIEYLLDDIYDI
jgi:hypothetical protein